MPRIKWTCPRCRNSIAVKEGTEPVCPNCQIAAPKARKKKSSWSVSDISFIVMGSLILIGLAGFGAHWAWSSMPKPDPDRALVEAWLKDNLEDGKWEQVKWFPAQSPRGLHDLNRLHVVEGIEVAKKLYEEGKGDDLREACEKLYKDVRDNGRRTFVAMSYRVTSFSGTGKVLKRQVFELVDGAAKPLANNEIVELQSAPSSRKVIVTGKRYDGWRFFDEKDFDPFIVGVPSDLEERYQAAMEWKEPIKKEATPAPAVTAPTQSEPKTVAVVAPTPVNTPKPETPAADPIPPRIREYFDRVTAAKNAEISVLQKRIEDFESKLRGLKIQQQPVMQERIRKTQDEIVQLQKTNGGASFPPKPAVGDVGSFQFVKVMKVVDGDSLIVRWSINGKGRLPQTDALIHHVPTKQLKVGDEFIGSDFFHIVATLDEPNEQLKSTAGVGNPVEFLAEPMNKSDVEKWRAQYEREQRSKK